MSLFLFVLLDVILAVGTLHPLSDRGVGRLAIGEVAAGPLRCDSSLALTLSVASKSFLVSTVAEASILCRTVLERLTDACLEQALLHPWHESELSRPTVISVWLAR